MGKKGRGEEEKLLEFLSSEVSVGQGVKEGREGKGRIF